MGGKAVGEGRGEEEQSYVEEKEWEERREGSSSVEEL